MAEDAMQRVLRLVSEGRLTAEEAGPILDALDQRQTEATESDQRPDARSAGPRQEPRFARIQVVESGRKAVDLRVPLSVGRTALAGIPGLSSAHAGEIDRAILQGVLGPIFDLQDEDGDGVRIVLE
jgi:hypothetical protein